VIKQETPQIKLIHPTSELQESKRIKKKIQNSGKQIIKTESRGQESSPEN
jgi:hypothetical protein